MQTMRAKMYIAKIEKYQNGDQIFLTPVSSKPYGPEGESEDNTYARYSPSGELRLMITNPNLVGSFVPGGTFYLDFTPAEQ